MRSIFSIRFLAAILAVVGLLFGLSVLFDAPIPVPSLRTDTFAAGGDQPTRVRTDPTVVETDEVVPRRIDLVDRVFGTKSTDFEVVDHLAVADGDLLIDAVRTVHIRAGTPGEDYCHVVHDIGSKCAILADLLGEGVIWFALVPIATDDEGEPFVPLPAIDELIDDRARLVNGWELPFDPILTRSCIDDGDPNTQDEFESYRQFREVLGDNFTSIYSIRRSGDPSRLSEVECRRQVAYAAQSVNDARFVVEY